MTQRHAAAATAKHLRPNHGAVAPARSTSRKAPAGKRNAIRCFRFKYPTGQLDTAVESQPDRQETLGSLRSVTA